MNNNFVKWFETFLEEKQVPYKSWDIECNGELNIIDTEVVIEAIKNCSPKEQQGIKDMIIRLDFVNAPILPYFEHLANALVKVRSSYTQR